MHFPRDSKFRPALVKGVRRITEIKSVKLKDLWHVDLSTEDLIRSEFQGPRKKLNGKKD